MFQKNAFIWLAPQRHKLKRRQIVFIKSHGMLNLSVLQAPDQD